MMTWDNVQTTAKVQNQLVFAMDQAQQTLPIAPPARDTSNAVGGYCMGLSIHWMERIYAGKNLPFNTLTQTYEDIDWTAMSVYEAYLKMPPEVQTQRWHGAASVLRMTANRGLRGQRWLQPADGKFLCETVGRAWGCYGITLAAKGAAANHAIAVRHARDNTFHLFDANYGHFAVKWIGKFSDFFNWYMQQTGYATAFADGCFVIGINPPMGG